MVWWLRCFLLKLFRVTSKRYYDQLKSLTPSSEENEQKRHISCLDCRRYTHQRRFFQTLDHTRLLSTECLSLTLRMRSNEDWLSGKSRTSSQCPTPETCFEKQETRSSSLPTSSTKEKSAMSTTTLSMISRQERGVSITTGRSTCIRKSSRSERWKSLTYQQWWRSTISSQWTSLQWISTSTIWQRDLTLAEEISEVTSYRSTSTTSPSSLRTESTTRTNPTSSPLTRFTVSEDWKLKKKSRDRCH